MELNIDREEEETDACLCSQCDALAEDATDTSRPICLCSDCRVGPVGEQLDCLQCNRAYTEALAALA